ncbi:P-type conjugative transfer protein TrbG [Novosphingobium terrae]|uniref:P-type conjugative transfer protein TrbG n=1 Tax=Novosphingobium terrae TaxID=2726189 RepID=UPI00197DC101|nr:P-type conjugative transfer protein TrbG [Novosphingobium terrae]
MKSCLIIALALLAGIPLAQADTPPPPPAPGTSAPTPAASNPKIVAQPVVQPVPQKAKAVARTSWAKRKRQIWPPEANVKAANRSAMREPQPFGFINAVQVYPWAEGALYRLMAAPGAVTDVTLQAGETIVSVAAGDTVRWTVGDTSSGAGDAKRAHILIKPFAAGLSTNLIIATDRRTYHLEMLSTQGTAMAAISWLYPQGELIAIARKVPEGQGAPTDRAGEGHARPEAAALGLPVERLNFAYAIEGDAPSWRPLRAFDDGRQTYIEFPASIAVGEAPPLFVIGSAGEAQLVNYRMSGHFYVVDRLFEAGELRLGGKKQVIVRISRKGGVAASGAERKAS